MHFQIGLVGTNIWCVSFWPILPLAIHRIWPFLFAMSSHVILLLTS